MQCLLFCERLILLRTMSLRYSHVIACDRIFKNILHYSTVFIYHVFFIHSPKDRHLGCFNLLTILSNTAMHIGMQIFLWDFTLSSFAYILISEIAGSYGNFIFKFLEISTLFLIVAVPVYIPSKVHKYPSFSASSPTLVIFFSFDSSHPNGEVISCGLDLHFLNDEWCWTSLSVIIGHLYIFFREVSIQVLCPFFNWVIWVFLSFFFFFFAAEL